MLNFMQKKIEELRNTIRRYDHFYYGLDNPLVSPILRGGGLHLEPYLANYGCPAREVNEKQHPSEASHHLILDHLTLLEQVLLRNVESFQDPKEENEKTIELHTGAGAGLETQSLICLE